MACYSSSLVTPNEYVETSVDSNPPSEAPEQDLFFRLPRELRDQIYEHALGTRSFCFCHDKMVIRVTMEFPPKHGKRKPFYAPGLPPWILANKAMCSEVLEAFGRTRIFLGLLKEIPGAFFEAGLQPKTILNPLVLNSNVIRRLGLERKLFPSQRYLERTRAFMRILESLQAHDLKLDLFWGDGIDEAIWFLAIFEAKALDSFMRQALSQPLEEYMTIWDDFWYGRFRKIHVIIDAIVHPADTLYLESLKKSAMFGARRLIGEGINEAE